MEFFRIKHDIPFMRHALVWNAISIVTFLLAVFFIATRGLHFSIEFTGGTVMEVSYKNEAPIESIRASLAEMGYEDAQVQNFGTSHDALIRLPLREGVSTADLAEQVGAKLAAVDDTMTVTRVEFVGPQVGEELRDQGGLAMLLALGGILVYLAFRFQWKFGVGAIASLAHDTILTLGLLALLEVPFDLTVLAAVLAMIGYSLNDTIIIYDRIRENFRVLRKASLIENIDISVTQTLLRTMATSFSTALALLALLFWGGDVLAGFAIALLIGVVVGTYSSVYIGATVLVWLKLTSEDLIPPATEEAADERP